MLYQGCNHSQAQCNSKKHQVDNICSNVLSADMTKQQVASKVLKELDIGEPNIVQLSTLGKPLQVAVQPEKQNSNSKLTANDVISMQINASLSDRQLFQMLRDIRLKSGRQSIESNVKSILTERKSIFSDLFF